MREDLILTTSNLVGVHHIQDGFLHPLQNTKLHKDLRTSCNKKNLDLLVVSFGGGASIKTDHTQLEIDPSYSRTTKEKENSFICR